MTDSPWLFHRSSLKAAKPARNFPPLEPTEMNVGQEATWTYINCAHPPDNLTGEPDRCKCAACFLKAKGARNIQGDFSLSEICCADWRTFSLGTLGPLHSSPDNLAIARRLFLRKVRSTCAGFPWRRLLSFPAFLEVFGEAARQMSFSRLRVMQHDATSGRPRRATERPLANILGLPHD